MTVQCLACGYEGDAHEAGSYDCLARIADRPALLLQATIMLPDGGARPLFITEGEANGYRVTQGRMEIGGGEQPIETLPMFAPRDPDPEQQLKEMAGEVQEFFANEGLDVEFVEGDEL